MCVTLMLADIVKFVLCQNSVTPLCLCECVCVCVWGGGGGGCGMSEIACDQK